MIFWLVAKREMKLGYRNPWSYTFLLLFSFFSLALVLIQANGAYNMEGYSNTVGTMMNLILYLLPLMTLLLGSFSVTSEKEEGGWQLLSTYSLSTTAFLAGKYLGVAIVLLSIVGFGYGLSGMIGSLVGQSFSLQTTLFLLLFSVGILLLYLGMAVVVGSLSKNRWQALTYSVGIWFVSVLAWPTLLISVLSYVPYTWIRPLLEILTLFNPAEFVRIFMVMQMGGGAVFGPEYFQWVDWAQRPSSSIIFLFFCLIWIVLSLGLAILTWERGRYRG